MKKQILSLLLLVGVVLSAFGGCGKSDNKKNSSDNSFTPVDYAAAVTLDLNSTETKKETATVKTYIDGDTTHFNVSSDEIKNSEGEILDVLKARYLAINTPESTGKIEEWGKNASNFTKEKLKTASSIVLETDGANWELDSTGGRHLVWVWYKPEGSTSYRNLNIEILQNGLAIASNSEGNRYGEICGKAIEQARQQKLHVYSGEKDPDFYYGDAQPMTLKELRLNIDQYNGQKVAFEGVITYLDDGGAYVESFDEETSVWFGMYVYYGFSVNPFLQEVFIPGNRFRIVGTVSYWEAGDSYQVSGLEYNMRNPDDPNSCKLLDEEKHDAANVETTLDTFYSKVEVSTEDAETGDVTTTEHTYAALAVGSSISMKNLKVVETYTTQSGDSKGAISITCEYGGKTIVVRTIVLKDTDGKVVTADRFVGKTIDVTGIIDYFKLEYHETGSHQIKVFNISSITIR
ncbi:MAG: thermonuclease family protein [Clostridia bacterium]|nr:thermonuclease family protein [Clostridia bacterium]